MMPQNIEMTNTSQVMEINSLNSSIVKKEVSSSPLPSPRGHSEPPDEERPPEGDLPMADCTYTTRILQREQQVQQQLLLHQYQQQQLQLAEQHEKELQHHIKYLEQQTARAEEERQEKHRQQEMDRLQAIKKKSKEEQSAVASTEVKQLLQDVIRKKQAAAQAAQGGNGSTNTLAYPRNCHPYRPSPGPHPHDDFPLRKTASEPNICLKVRLKQRVIERRSSPLTRRKDRPGAAKRRPPPTGLDSCSTPDSGQSSPPNGAPTSRSSSGSTPINEEGSVAGSNSGYGPLEAGSSGVQGSCSDLTLYSSPSLPNISLGRPPHSSQQEGMKLSMVSETEGRGEEGPVGPLCPELSMTGHVLPSTLPYYPTLPVSILEGSCYPSSSRLAVAMASMDTHPPGGVHLMGACQPPYPAPPVSMADVQGRLNRSIQRPLGRTQSAPLPLGHPMLQGNPPTFMPSNLPPSLQYDPNLPLEHNLVKQHVRKTVLTRSGSKNHVENVEEETEAAVAQAIAPERIPPPPQHVIDLTAMRAAACAAEARLSRGLISHREILAARLNASGSSMPRSGTHIARPLSRAQSSPLVTLCTGPQEPPHPVNKKGATTGLAYDSLMQKHQCICGDNTQHPEHGGRLQAVWARLQDTGLAHACHRLRPRKATLEEIQSCHSEAHTLLFGTNPLNRQSLDMSKLAELPIKSFVRLQCGGIGVDSDTTWNELHTASAARMAAGCVIELACKVATGELRNGYALVRPPGHHAEHQTAMGFCFFNSVAIAARQLQQKLNLDKIFILDWDVHHGNGTQSMFYEDPHILYMSMHRYDDGSFFPGTGAPQEVGEGDGYGFNVNIAWSGSLNPPMGDAEYLAAFRTVVMPIAEDFNPDIVLVSAGFDAADGHPGPLGGYRLSPECFAHMTSQLMTLARGKVVLALEGGYHISSVCDATEACIRTLLGEPVPPLPARHVHPCQPARDTLHTVIAVQSAHWPVVRRMAGYVGLSAAEADGRQDEQDTVSAMASLRVNSCAAVMAAAAAAESSGGGPTLPPSGPPLHVIAGVSGAGTAVGRGVVAGGPLVSGTSLPSTPERLRNLLSNGRPEDWNKKARRLDQIASTIAEVVSMPAEGGTAAPPATIPDEEEPMEQDTPLATK